MELRKYKNHFENEIDFESFSAFGDMVAKLLILFKLKCEANLKVEEQRLRVVNNPSEEPFGNCIIIDGAEVYASEESLKADISAFLNSEKHAEAFKSKVTVYVDEEKKITQIMSENKDLEISYMNNKLIGLILSRLVPWHFNTIKKDDPNQDRPGLKSDVFAMISELTSSNDESLEKMLMEEIRARDIDNDIFMKDLEALGAKIMERKRSGIVSRLSENRSMIQDHIREIARLSERIRDDEFNIKAIELGEADVKQPIIDVMNLVKNSPEDIVIDDLQDSWLKLSFRVPMDNFEFDEYQSYVVDNHGGSYFFHGAAGDYDRDSLRKLYKAIFDTRKLKVYFNSGMKINLENGSLEKHTSSYPVDRCMNHPHLDMGYFCTGNTSSFVAQYVAENALAEAITLVIQSARQFSICDTTIGQKFISGIFKHDCIEMPNGEYMNADKAMKYIKNHKEEFDD